MKLTVSAKSSTVLITLISHQYMRRENAHIQSYIEVKEILLSNARNMLIGLSVSVIIIVPLMNSNL
mgnify:CR=1 FL=1